MSDYYECGTHALKTNISRYIKWLEEGTYRAIIVKRGTRKVAMLVPLERPKPENAKNADLVRNSD
jgi:antitoxin (DNA-binding transcriptional repressor) of toxin-antitoxin stability system